MSWEPLTSEQRVNLLRRRMLTAEKLNARFFATVQDLQRQLAEAQADLALSELHLEHARAWAVALQQELCHQLEPAPVVTMTRTEVSLLIGEETVEAAIAEEAIGGA